MKKQLFTIAFLLPLFLASQNDLRSLKIALQHHLDWFILVEDRPGATLAIVLPDGQLISQATGFSDKEAVTPMPLGSQMFTGSTGKTFFSALALQLVSEGIFSLDDKLQCKR